MLARLCMSLEETIEWIEAHEQGDLVAVADALGDRAYLLLGDAVSTGIPLDKVFAEVHRSNMTKKGGLKSSEGKGVKAGGFEEPQLIKLLDRSATTKPLFDCYLFADFSGGSEDHSTQASIKLYKAEGKAEPKKLSPIDGSKNYSRKSLVETINAELSKATKASRRVIFGCDHQYSWPLLLWEKAGLNDAKWREGILTLWQGDESRKLPKLDIPSRYCKLFNEYCNEEIFWSPLKERAKRYGIESNRPNIDATKIYRLTEQVSPLQGRSNPKPANAVGGMGEGIVGGQTICGMKLIAQMLHNDSIGWWPFEGLDIMDSAFDGKHVGVEIYPSALRPESVPQTDDNDAFHSCLYVQHADQLENNLVDLLDLSEQIKHENQLLKEGWIVGMNQEGLRSL